MPLRVQLLAPPSKITCPCCGGAPDSFLPIPSEYVRECEARGVEHPLQDWETLNLDGYLCPECGSTDRDRLQVAYLSTIVRPGMHVLEIAPSPPVSNWIRGQEGVLYRSADLEMNHTDDRVDITNMSCYPDACFDVVLCSHVLEHVPDDLRAMRELKRVLASGGAALLLVPISLHVEGVDEDPSLVEEGERWRRFGQGDHVRIYGREGFVRRLREAGFAVRTFRPAEPESFGLSPSSALYVGS